jgi:hypothetical protein
MVSRTLGAPIIPRYGSIPQSLWVTGSVPRTAVGRRGEPEARRPPRTRELEFL